MNKQQQQEFRDCIGNAVLSGAGAVSGMAIGLLGAYEQSAWMTVIGVAIVIAAVLTAIYTANKVDKLFEATTKRKKVAKPSATKDNVARNKAGSYGLGTEK